MIGEHVGRYEILRALGSGAMGEVYAAHDERLGREVALKILRPQFAEDFERRERFEREAKAIAALDHPNIVTIYSVEEEDGTHFLTMQLVHGRTLSEVIPNEGLALDKLLDIALRLVEAVSAAHQRGVVHRDLKPSNVMVGEDGRLKILDFGLAKLRPTETDLAALGDPATIGLTLDGQIIGTVAYMSPEQAEGREADHRSDIFSLGVLLYEMATGGPPFTGDTPISVMSSIIKDTPSVVTQVRPTLPPHIGRIIRTCLAKDPIRRYQTAIDLRNALDDLKLELQSGETEKAALPDDDTLISAPVRRRAPVPWRGIAAAVVAAVAVFFVGLLAGRTTMPADPPALIGAPVLTPLTGQAGLAGKPSWSPEGTEIVYASNEAGTMDIWRRVLDGPARQLTDFRASETDPVWAPNGRRVAYTDDRGNGGIAIISPEGGTPTSITSFGARPQWSPDSQRIVFDWRGDVYVVDAQATADPLSIVRDTSGHPHPVWSHDGRFIYFWNRTQADVQITDLEGNRTTSLSLVPTGEEVAGLATSPDGTFLIVSRGPYGGNKDLWKVPLDPTRGLATGIGVRLTQPVNDDVDPALSPDGTRLAFASRRISRHLWGWQLDSETGRTNGIATQLTGAAELNYYPAVSPDGKMLVWTAHRTNQGLLHLLRLEGPPREVKATTAWGTETREIGGTFSPDGTGLLFTSTEEGDYELWQVDCLEDCVPVSVTNSEHPDRDVLPAWSPRGDSVAYYSNRSGNWDVWLRSLANGAPSRPLTKSIHHEMYPVWSPEGNRIAYWTNENDAGGDIWVMDANGANAHAVAAGSAEEGWGVWSPDGRWFYFTSDRSGAFNVWVQDERGKEEPRQVTRYNDLAFGLPEAAIFTKFAVTNELLIVPVEERSGGLWILEDLR